MNDEQRAGRLINEIADAEDGHSARALAVEAFAAVRLEERKATARHIRRHAESAQKIGGPWVFMTVELLGLVADEIVCGEHVEAPL